MGEPMQGSAQHNPRIDDDIDREPAAVEEVTDTTLWNGPGQDGVVGPAENYADRADLRSDIGSYISLAHFPTDAEALAVVARRNSAPDNVLDELGALAPAARFANAAEVWAALGLSPGRRA